LNIAIRCFGTMLKVEGLKKRLGLGFARSTTTAACASTLFNASRVSCRVARLANFQLLRSWMRGPKGLGSWGGDVPLPTSYGLGNAVSSPQVGFEAKPPATWRSGTFQGLRKHFSCSFFKSNILLIKENSWAKRALTWTLNTTGQFLNCPGEFCTVGMPMCIVLVHCHCYRPMV